MFKIVCLIVFLSIETKGARILAVFPVPSISHQVVFRPLTQELAKRGHEVVVVTPDPAFPRGKTPANLSEIDVHEKSYTLWRETFLAMATGKKDDHLTLIKVSLDLLTKIFVEQMKTDEVQNILRDKNQKFDLLLLEACVIPALAISHIYKVPVIQISSFGGVYDNFDIIGASVHPILTPMSLNQRVYNLTNWEKLVELYNYYSIINVFKSSEKSADEVLRKEFRSDLPNLFDLRRNVHMLFLNIHPLWDGNRPVPPGVIYMGGLHQKIEKELPKDLQYYLNSSKNGVIYVSFGTNVDTSLLPPEKLKILVNVFSKLPFDILWKWDQDELAGKSKNIRISKWFPQSDLLKHPKIKLFVTQGGLQSTDEAITAGLPLIAIPMLGDQWYNAELYENHRIGKKLDIETITEEVLNNAIDTVLKDESYRRNIAHLRSVMRDQPDTPIKRAVWWTEHVLRHGGASHLRAPTANITWTQYLELELVLIVFSCLLTILILLLTTLYYAAKIFYPRNNKLKRN